jgi:hypothetical protein
MLTPEEVDAFQRDLRGLSETEIKRRLDHHIWRGERRTLAEQHLEKLELERRERFGAKDRQLQEQIFWVAVVGVVVGAAGFIATLITR